jgi:hypothetical protein
MNTVKPVQDLNDSEELVISFDIPNGSCDKCGGILYMNEKYPDVLIHFCIAEEYVWGDYQTS